jgi:RNA polymerase sigma-70 factor (ECF subfamily)
MEFTINAAASPGDALEAALDRYHEALVRRLTLIVRDPEEAADLAQSACARALERRGRFDGRDPRGWLYSIGINLALNELRRRRRWLARPVAEADATWAIEVDPDLWSALGELEPRVRAALLMNVLDGYSQAEIATSLRVPEGTVASWLVRAKRRLRDRLGEGE